MISRPTTEQIILDCRRELLESIRPAVSDPAVAVAIDMLENVLRNVATRAAHEIAWMVEETATMTAYAREVRKVRGGAGGLDLALEHLAALSEGSLHLESVIAAYDAAGEAFSCALEGAMSDACVELRQEGVSLLADRTAREQEIKGEWSMTGRG